jgi:hypothetical protein
MKNSHQSPVLGRQLCALALVAALALITSAFSCETNGEYAKAVRANAAIASSLKAAATETIDLHKAHLLTDVEAAAVAVEIDKAASANDEFHGALLALKDLQPNRAAVVGYVDQIAQHVDAIAGIFVSDPQARAKVAAVIAGVRIPLATLRTLLASTPGNSPNAAGALTTTIGGTHESRTDRNADEPRGVVIYQRVEADRGTAGAGTPNRRAAVGVSGGRLSRDARADRELLIADKWRARSYRSSGAELSQGAGRKSVAS